jgi:hypothetical protein
VSIRWSAKALSANMHTQLLAEMVNVIDASFASLISRICDSAFGIDSTAKDLINSKCTSCAIDKDFSVYWTPPLYFQHANGSFEKVPQRGGMLA